MRQLSLQVPLPLPQLFQVGLVAVAQNQKDSAPASTLADAPAAKTAATSEKDPLEVSPRTNHNL